MKLSPENIITLKGYFKNKPVSKVYLTHQQSEDSSGHIQGLSHTPVSISSGKEVNFVSDCDGREVNILVDLESGRHVALTFFKMKVELEDILKQKVDLVSSGGFSQVVMKTPARSEHLIYAKAG